MTGLSDLETQIAKDLESIRFPERSWTMPVKHPSGTHVYDVIIIGAGQCGLTVAFALMRRRITNIIVLDAARPGQQGPWCTYGRMRTLRSPKHFNGPDLDIPSLTCESWFSATYGGAAWENLKKIPCKDWQEYLLWFRRVLKIPVRYQTLVEQVLPERDSLLRVTAAVDGAAWTTYARKVVFATGMDGTGAWRVPSFIQESLPPDRYSRIADSIDFTRLADARIGVLGGGASAYDNAAVALEAGAQAVDLFFRRPRLHRVNPYKWTQFAGFLENFRDLPDEWRWRFMLHILPQNEPPPPEAFMRAVHHPNFRLHLGEQWTGAAMRENKVMLTTTNSTYEFDHLLIAIGLVQDVKLQKELSSIECHIARWGDKYAPPAAEENKELAQFPYLGPNFEYVEREPGNAPYLADIYNFTTAATISHGPSGASINGLKQAAHRIASGICRDFLTRSVSEYYQDFLAYDTLELDVPWAGDSAVIT